MADGVVNGKKCRIIFDYVSQCSLISRAQIKYMKISTKSCGEYAKTPSGQREWPWKTTKLVNLNLEEYVEGMKLLLCNLQDYDIIIVKYWHNIYNSDIDFPSNTLRLHFKRKKNSINAIFDDTIPFISKKDFSKSLQRGNQRYAVTVKKNWWKPGITRILSSIWSQAILCRIQGCIP